MPDQTDLPTELAKINTLLRELETALPGPTLKKVRKLLFDRRTALVQSGVQAASSNDTAVLKRGQPESDIDQQNQIIHGSQTNVEGNIRGPVLSGQFQGPVNTGDTYIGLSRQMIQKLQNNLPQDDPLQQELAEFSNILEQFRFFHNLLYEWKELHNHINEILFAMGQFDELVKDIREQPDPPNVWKLKDSWRPVSEKISLMLDWTKNTMQYIDSRKFNVSASGAATGPDWAADIYNFWASLENLLDNPKDFSASWSDAKWLLGENEGDLKDKTETYMLIVDKRLLNTAEDLHELSIKMLGE